MPKKLTFEYVSNFITDKGYVIVDMGKFNKKFVEQEFELFMLMRMIN